MNQIFKSNKTLEEHFPGIVKDNSSPGYVAVTNDITVTVWPEFIDSKLNVAGDIFIWAYNVRIDNRSANNVQLLKRFWKIIDEKGTTQEVSGDGVIGEQPIISSGSSYQYSSGVHLNHPSGIMSGEYTLQNVGSDEGEILKVKVPTFSLDVPGVKRAVN